MSDELDRKVDDAAKNLGPGNQILGAAGPGDQVFLSRRNRLILMFRDGEASNVIDMYRDHPLQAQNPTMPESGVVQQESESLIHIMDLPSDQDWYLLFMRLDAPPVQLPFPESVLSGVEEGQYFVIPLAPGGVKVYGVEDMPNPVMTLIQVLRDDGGCVSVVAAIGPGNPA